MLRYSVFTYLLLSLLVVLHVYGQNPAPVHTVDGEHIREWLVLGPFFPNDLDRDFLADAGGEANIEPREGDTVTTAEGETLTWKRYKAKGNIIDLLDAVGNHEDATAYAFCVLQNETTGDEQIHIGHDDGAMVWLNGKQVHSNPRVSTIDQYQFETPLKLGANRCLIKVSQWGGPWWLASRVEILLSDRAVVSGTIADETGKPVLNASVRLEQDEEETARTTTDSSGSYRLDIHLVRGEYDLFATRDEIGGLRSGIRLREGDRRTLDLALRKAISIEGTLFMLDDRTPHVAVPVQAVRNGKVMATALSNEGGRYKLINLKPGRYQVRCQVPGGYVYYGEGKAREPESQKAGGRGSEEAGARGDGDILRVEHGKTVENIDFRFAPFKKGTWGNYTSFDGLPYNVVRAICRDPDGILWIGTGRGGSFNLLGGVSRYDGKAFTNFTTKDGLASNCVLAIHRDPDGVLWFGTDNGVSRYDGRTFVNYTTHDGLAHNVVFAIYTDTDGVKWFGTGGGLSRYEEGGLINFTTRDGLVANDVWYLHRISDDRLWIGTRYGASLFDGKSFVNFTTQDGLTGNYVRAVHVAPDGMVWFATNDYV